MPLQALQPLGGGAASGCSCSCCLAMAPPQCCTGSQDTKALKGCSKLEGRQLPLGWVAGASAEQQELPLKLKGRERPSCLPEKAAAPGSGAAAVCRETVPASYALLPNFCTIFVE